MSSLDVPAGPWLSQTWATSTYTPVFVGQTVVMPLYGLFLGRFWAHVTDDELWKEHTQRYRAFLYGITGLLTIYALLIVEKTCYWGSESLCNSPKPALGSLRVPSGRAPTRAHLCSSKYSSTATQYGGSPTRARRRCCCPSTRRPHLGAGIGNARLQGLLPLLLSASQVDVPGHGWKSFMYLICRSAFSYVQYHQSKPALSRDYQQES